MTRKNLSNPVTGIMLHDLITMRQMAGFDGTSVSCGSGRQEMKA
jgi:hypothetical protein